MSPFFVRLLYQAFSNLYDDLKEAEKFLRSKEELVAMTFVKPGALTNQPHVGHELSLEQARSPLSYLDLATEMVDIADDSSGRYGMQGIAVNSTARVSYPWEARIKIFKGLLCHFSPWLYPYIG